MPYKDEVDDYFAKACSFGLSAFFCFALVLKVRRATLLFAPPTPTFHPSFSYALHPTLLLRWGVPLFTPATHQNATARAVPIH